jgi:hypothetical protein
MIYKTVHRKRTIKNHEPHKIRTFLLKIILKLPLITNLHKKFTLKLVTRNEICFQNYIKFTKNPKQTKILILNNFTIRQNYYF